MSASEKRELPLDVLVVGMHAHSPGYWTEILLDNLATQPLVRSYGSVHREADARVILQSGEANTLFLDPYAEPYGVPDLAAFIRDVHQRYADVVMVLHTSTQMHRHFIDAHPDLAHYWYMVPLARWLEEDQPASPTRLEDMLSACSKWHRQRYEYDFVLTFAGEDRELAAVIAARLRAAGASVFYDDYEQARLLGKNLYVELYEIYARRGRYCIMLASKAYVKKLWTSHERTAAQERAFSERKSDYIIPIRIDLVVYQLCQYGRLRRR